MEKKAHSKANPPDGRHPELSTAFFSDMPTESSQALAIVLLRRLAENGLLYARLMGRDLLPAAEISGTSKAGDSKTIGHLLTLAMADLQLAVIDGNKEAQARRKGRAEPTEAIPALVR